MNSDLELVTEKQSFNNDGFCCIENCLPLDLLDTISGRITALLEMACCELDINADSLKKGDFTFDTAALFWAIISCRPDYRNRLYQAIQRIPEVHACVNLPAINAFTQAMAFERPLLSELKIQMYLPWEKLFFQKYHQDINTLKSKQSITFWLPLHDIRSESAVLFKPGSQKLGPVKHVENIAPDFGVYHSALPDEQVQRFAETVSVVSKKGDLVALDRLVFHSSPAFELQKKARWIILVRIDDMQGETFSTADQSYLQYTPFTPERYHNEIIPKVRAFLSQRPKLQWKVQETNS